MDLTEFREKLVAALLPKYMDCGLCGGSGTVGWGYAEDYEVRPCRAGCVQGRVPAKQGMQLRMTADEIADVVCGILAGSPLNPLDTHLP